MKWSERPLYSKVIAILAILGMVVAFLLAVAMPLLLGKDDGLVQTLYSFQYGMLIPAVKVLLVLALADLLIQSWRKGKTKA